MPSASALRIRSRRAELLATHQQVDVDEVWIEVRRGRRRDASVRTLDRLAVHDHQLHLTQHNTSKNRTSQVGQRTDQTSEWDGQIRYLDVDA